MIFEKSDMKDEESDISEQITTNFCTRCNSKSRDARSGNGRCFFEGSKKRTREPEMTIANYKKKIINKFKLKEEEIITYICEVIHGEDALPKLPNCILPPFFAPDTCVTYPFKVL